MVSAPIYPQGRAVDLVANDDLPIRATEPPPRSARPAGWRERPRATRHLLHACARIIRRIEDGPLGDALGVLAIFATTYGFLALSSVFQ